MTIEELEEWFRIAKEQGKDIAIELTVPTRTATEIIIVKNDNLDYKLDYYKQAYNKNLELERCKDIKILSVRIIKWKEI